VSRSTSTDANGVIGRNVDKRDLDRLPTRYTILVGAIIVRRCEYSFVNFLADRNICDKLVLEVIPYIRNISTFTDSNFCNATTFFDPRAFNLAETVCALPGVVVVHSGAAVEA